MKAFDLNFPGIHGYSSTDDELETLVREAGYASTRAFLNDSNWWNRDVESIKSSLRAEIARTNETE